MTEVSTWIPWIYRGFLIVTTITVIWAVFSSVATNINTEISRGMQEYRQQAASLAALNSPDRNERIVIDEPRFITVEGEDYCTVNYLPGFGSFFSLRSTGKGECHRTYQDPNPGTDNDFGHFYLSPGDGDINEKLQVLEVNRIG